MEHASATESVHRIPLIMYVPNVTKPGSSCSGFVYNVDVIATITDLVGLPVPSGWDGTSFLPAIHGDHWQGHDYLVMDHGLYVCQRAVRDKKWYFIRTYHPGLFRQFDEVTLYDMENDPNQVVNVAELHPDVVKEMDSRLIDWMQKNVMKPGHKVDPMQKVIETGPWKYLTVHNWVDRLQKLGYPEAAEKLQNEYAKEGVSSAYGIL